jgi:hypothetical protein
MNVKPAFEAASKGVLTGTKVQALVIIVYVLPEANI